MQHWSSTSHLPFEMHHKLSTNDKYAAVSMLKKFVLLQNSDLAVAATAADNPDVGLATMGSLVISRPRRITQDSNTSRASSVAGSPPTSGFDLPSLATTLRPPLTVPTTRVGDDSTAPSPLAPAHYAYNKPFFSVPLPTHRCDTFQLSNMYGTLAILLQEYAGSYQHKHEPVLGYVRQRLDRTITASKYCCF